MESVRFRIESESPLIMHNGQLANPFNPIVKQMKQITGKRKKTDEDLAALAWLEFQGGLYHDEEMGPHIPGAVLEAALKAAAKLQRRGKDVARAIIVVEDRSKLEYKGPREPAKLFGDGASPYVDARIMKVGTSRVLRTRPIFREWAAEFTVSYDSEVFNDADVVTLVQDAGKSIGLLDSRPRFGRFTAKVVK